MMMRSFEETIQDLERVPLYGHKDGTRNIDRLMACFGHPEQNFNVIHVAGTNGKGSCCAMLSSILQEAGYTVGLYTSPHLVDYCERIQISGENISQDDFSRLYEKVMVQNHLLVEAGFHHITYFEILTAMAFLYFAEHDTDYVVLETGVGGRLDATNIIRKPKLCLITSISLDHTTVLGHTVEDIAAEKAGILKKDVPAVIGANRPSVYQVIREIAVSLSVPLCYAVEQPVRLVSESKNGQVIEAEGYEGRLDLPLTGAYQRENVQSVLCALRQLGDSRLTEPVIRQGLSQVRWPGRMQYLEVNGRDVVLDGAHNEDAASWLHRYMTEQNRRITLILAVLKKKDMTSILKAMLEGEVPVEKIYSVPVQDTPSAEKDEIDAVLRRIGYTGEHHRLPSSADALDEAVSDSTDNLILAAGSLYLVGEILRTTRTGDLRDVQL